jgi:SAM-dependent methyltransferase
MDQSVWENIYITDFWESGSGPGSIPEMALPWILFVNDFIKNKGIKSILDLGSGDGRIFSRLDIGGAEYVGLEASKEAISIFKQNNPGFKHKIINSNLIEAQYPESDLILIKDVLQHNSYSDVLEILNKAKSSCKYLLICEDFSEEDLPDILPGDWRPINFSNPLIPTKTNLLFTYGMPDRRYKALKGVYLYLREN